MQGTFIIIEVLEITWEKLWQLADYDSSTCKFLWHCNVLKNVRAENPHAIHFRIN